jgi:hypothetical protein
MSYPIRLIPVILVCLALRPAVAAPPSGHLPGGDLEAGLSAAAGRLDSLRVKRDSLQGFLDGLSREVAALQGRVLAGGFSPVEQYRLSEKLRASQALADSLDRVNREVSALTAGIARQRAELYRISTAAVDSLTAVLGRTRGTREREELLGRIGELRLRRVALYVQEEPGGRKTTAAGLAGVSRALEIGPEDGPEEIREKADFVDDLTDKLSRSLRGVETDIGRLSEENALRRRIGEFAQDISLFDEGLAANRAQARAGGAIGTPPSSATGKPDEGIRILTQGQGGEQFGKGGGAIDLETSDLEKDQALLRNLESLSTRELEAALGQLKTRRDSLRTDLDSLRALARNFREKAAQDGRGKEGAGPQ